MNLLIEKCIPPLIIGASIIASSIIISNSNNYEFIRINGSAGEHGFSILNNKNNGRSCLLDEGAVGTVGNWEVMAKHNSAPRELCNESQASKKKSFSFGELNIPVPLTKDSAVVPSPAASDSK